MRLEQPPQGANTSCLHQCEWPGKSRLTCSINHSGLDSIDATTCYNCAIGKLYREKGCQDITGQIIMINSIASPSPISTTTMFKCARQNHLIVSPEICHACTLVGCQPQEEILSVAKHYLDIAGFSKVKECFDTIKERIEKKDLDGALTACTTAAETTLRHIYDKNKWAYPNKQTLTGLWKDVRDKFQLPAALKETLGMLTGLIERLEFSRRELSDAHGKGVFSDKLYESFINLYQNLSASLIIFLVQRHLELNQK